MYIYINTYIYTYCRGLLLQKGLLRSTDGEGVASKNTHTYIFKCAIIILLPGFV